MTRTLLSRSLFAVLVLGSVSLASAQTVTARGLVQDNGTVIKMMFTPLKLESTFNVNLQNLVGTWVEVTGQLSALQKLDVQTTTPITDIMTVSSATVPIGGTVSVTVKGPAGRMEQMHWALDNDFNVVHDESWFLNFSTSTQLNEGIIGPGGALTFIYSVQNDPSLIGVKVYLQNVFQDGTQMWRIGNIDSFTVS